MIAAAESSGTIEDILKKLAYNYDKETKIRQKIIGALMYPMVLGGAAIVMVVFMLIFVLPTFIEMFEDNGTTIPAITQFVINISDSIQKFWYIYVIVIGGSIFGYKTYKSTESGLKNIDKMKFKIPGVNNYVTMLVTTRFTRTLSTLIYSGVPLINALESTSKVLGNEIAKEKVIDIQTEVQRGQELSSCVKKAGLFPPMVDNMIRIGEESGTLDDILEKTADYFDDELDSAVTNMTSIFEPMLLIVMGVVLGFIVIAMALPMFDVLKTVS
jgi:type IV pilus assembly protein PilC